MSASKEKQSEPFPVLRAADLETRPAQQRWLIRELWSHQAVGIVGGCPKAAKTWFGLDLAISVASDTPCLDRFAVQQPGPALIYLAEDAPDTVRHRVESICLHRDIDINTLDLHVITSPRLRLDVQHDRRRLEATIRSMQPRVLLLDPLVRLHSLDEDRASDISRILGYLRELQRTFGVAVVLVHHAGKKHRAHPGQALRGSSDLHAWTDSAAYLARKNDRITLVLEQRAAPVDGAFELELVSRPDGSATHLAVVEETATTQAPSLAEAVLVLLGKAEAPLYRSQIRARLKVNNQRLGEALLQLERDGVATRSSKGWQAAPAEGDPRKTTRCKAAQLTLTG